MIHSLKSFNKVKFISVGMIKVALHYCSYFFFFFLTKQFQENKILFHFARETFFSFPS